jgi:hypothetical protein
MTPTNNLIPPRLLLPVEQLPRGLVLFPPHIVERVALEKARRQPYYTEDYARKTLEDQTLAWYYEGLPVAYRPMPDGVEVLAVGWEETSPYKRCPVDGVKVVQP